MKKLNKRLLTLLLTVALVATNAINISAITTEELTEQSAGTTQVSGIDATGKFSITMKDITDQITVYQIAEMVWENGTYNPVSWVAPVEGWFRTNYPAYDTPAKLAAAASTTQTQVLQELFGKFSYDSSVPEGSKKPALNYTVALASYKVDAGNITKNNPTDRVIADESIVGADYTKLTDCYKDTANKIYKPGDSYVYSSVTYRIGTDDVSGTDLTAVAVVYEETATGKLYEEGELIEEAKEGTFLVDNVKLGMYMVLGTVTSAGETSDYAPLTVNVVPEKDGAIGNWYLKDEITASMKAANIYMNKTINGLSADEVRIGERVQFEINFRTPQYGERDTTQSNVAAYTLTFDDTLAPAFTLDATSVKVMIKGDGGSWSELANGDTKEYYNAIIAGARPSTAAPTLANENYGLSIWGCSTSHFESYVIYENAVPVDTDKNGTYDEIWYYYYYFRDGAYHLLRNTTPGANIKGAGSISYSGCPITPSAERLATRDSKNGYCIRALYSRATGDTVNHGWQEFPVSTYSTWYKGKFGKDYNPNLFNVTFNYNNLKADSLQNRELRITYEATVNELAAAGVETNSNVATMKYETNASGTLFDTISDDVKAYTYSLQLMKRDGTDDTPLKNAEFNLYKEAYHFDASGDYESVVGSGYSVPSETNISYYENKNDFYVLPEYTDKVLVGYRVFVLYTMATPTKTNFFNGTIKSTEDVNGVKVVGLDSGNYVLKETATPSSAYNELAEDVLFSIRQLDADVIESTYGGSLMAFKDAADQVHEDGNYPITVLNYKGVTLPSTGGIGTTIFIILGVTLMLLAMLFVIIKNKKAKEASAFVIAAVVLAGTVLGGTSDVKAITTIIANDSNGTQVTGDRTTSFVINVKDAADEVEVYQIAEMKWDDTEKTYNEVAWVYDVKAWLHTTNGKAFAAYDTPKKLGAADTKVQTSFWDALLADKEINNLESSDKVEETFVVKSSPKGDETIYTVSERPYGIYLILGRNGSKEYQPLTVNAMPSKEGPAGHFFLKSNISGSLKFETVSVDKYINGEEYATVKTGDEVRFTIDGEVPSYPEKEEGDTSKYPLSINDVMSSAFTYKEDTATVKYYTTADGWQTLDPSKYTLLMRQKASGTTTTSYGMGVYTSGAEKIYVNVFEEVGSTYYDCYSLDSEGYQLVKLNDTKIGGNFNTVGSISNPVVVARYNALHKTNIASFARTTAGWSDVYNVTFDYDALVELHAEKVQLEYTAIVTSSVQVGVETNTNTAYLYYQKNAGGDFDPATSTVHAYTYGMNLVKLDGESETRKPLAGAQFHLYEQKFLYVPDSTVTGGIETVPTTETADYGKYKFVKDIYDGITAPTGYTSTASAVEALNTLEKFTKVTTAPGGTTPGDITSTDTYYRKIKVATSETPCEHDGYLKEHYHIYACVLVDGSIVSVATEAGVTVNGLEPATYVLRETLQPEGYNILKEAIIFEINDVSAEDITNGDAATHATFKGDDGNFYATGIYPIEVANYKGTQLPSTGGIGTLIFTFVGITLMLSVMLLIVIVVRRRRESEI